MLGIADSDDPELATRADDKKLSEMTWVASGFYEKSDFAGAALRYSEILEEYPSDSVAKSMLSRSVHQAAGC